ncbi:MAG TPA: folylpolyglutamate synthase/dihydrofolate synthase family protein [Bryobacteraceae bacterium]|jgi:dihydrofolate synthase/folylpolyglutamate synthase|nr:folylpolyglutamate synthase/dihydrofolate synthase family protein [Bryobacteraceae bacterium]
MMTYPDSVRFLYALGNEIKTAKLGLERIRAVLNALGDPQNDFRSIHVAGTNGKGSTCAMIDAGLRTAGVRTGLFTSPHLIEPTERIVIEGMAVTFRQFERAFNEVHRVAGEIKLDYHPTYFETVTAMGFWLFREMGVETAVVETGLGGRLDATNVLEPALTVITPIDFDHEAYLGGTIEAIATEKAGILKPGVPAIFARQRPEAQSVLDQRAGELGIPVKYTRDFAVRDLHVTARGSEFSGLKCPLAGEHQIENAIAAALALESLGVSPKGIENAVWPGRLEQISPNPDIILDGAHNPAGARALARYLERFYAGRKIWMIYGAMRDKAVEEIAGILFPLASELILTAPDNARALRPEALYEIAGRGQIAPTISAALDRVRAGASEDDVVIITGSLFLVGEARALSYNKHSWPFSGAWSS